MNLWLLDTGPIVAYFDPRDPHHEDVASVLDSFSGQFVTTGAVVVEAMHFLGRFNSGPAMLVEFLVATGTGIHESTSPKALIEAAELMDKYSDLPMDFADATLVLLGDQLKTLSILTLDRRGFRTYRSRRHKQFRLVLDDDES